MLNDTDILLSRGIQQRVDFDVFKQHKVYEKMIIKLTEKRKSNQPWIDFFSKNNKI